MCCPCVPLFAPAVTPQANAVPPARSSSALADTGQASGLAVVWPPGEGASVVGCLPAGAFLPAGRWHRGTGQAWSQAGTPFFALGQEASPQSCSKANSLPVREAARHSVPIYPVVKCAAPAVCQLHPGPWALGSMWSVLGAQCLGLALSLALAGCELGPTHKNLWTPSSHTLPGSQQPHTPSRCIHTWSVVHLGRGR